LTVDAGYSATGMSPFFDFDSAADVQDFMNQVVKQLDIIQAGCAIVDTQHQPVRFNRNDLSP